MTSQQFTVSGNDAPASAPPLLGVAGEDLFAPWPAKQEDDPELTALAALVSETEQDLADARRAIPIITAARTEAEDEGDGAKFSDAVATLAGLPRFVKKLVARRTEASLLWLARVAALAQGVAVKAAEDGRYLTPELIELRREQFAQQSGRQPVERGQASPGGISERVYSKLLLEQAPYAALEAEALNVVQFAQVRCHLLDVRPGDSKLDLFLPGGWEPAIQFASERAELEARREIKNGK